MKDLYGILGVNKTASPEEIKRAYRRMASQHHPDKGGDTNRFQEIEQAYRVLSDPAQRQQYDNPQPQFSGFNFNTNGGAPFDFQSIFDIFGTRFGHQPHPQTRQARMSLWISLADVATGGARTISVGTNSGTVALEIELPAGIEDGATVQYPNLAPGGGDLIISFRIKPDPKWTRQGSTLITDRTVTVWDLIVGGETQIEDILGRRLTLTIPPRTQPGTMLRLAGRGLPNRSAAPGDMLVRLQARIPDQIDADLINLIESKRGQ